MITHKSIIGNIRTYKQRVGKSQTTSGDEFKVTLIRKDNHKKMTFSFYDNLYNKATLSRMLECLILDRVSFLDYKKYEDFCWAFGYDPQNKESKDCYNGCREETTKLNKFFTRREIEVLSSYYL